MLKNQFLQTIRKNTPDNIKVKVRKYADVLIKKGEEKEEEILKTKKQCIDCRCVDMEDWFLNHE
jgi:hypothetical protein